MAIVFVAGAFLAAMINRSPSSLVFLLYVKIGLLVFASLRAKYGPAHAKDWWFGFAVFGWARLAMTFAEPRSYHQTIYTRFNPLDMTEWMAWWLSDKVCRNGLSYVYHFTEVLHSYAMLGAAVLGGIVTSFLSRQSAP